MRIAFVVAIAENGVIGAGGALAWRISDDLKWFKKVTLGKPLIMGRKTFQSIGKALPGRDNIVVTRDQEFSAPDIFVARDVNEALSMAARFAEEREADEICVIGGGEIYAQLLPRADRIYLTRVEAVVEGDVYFPKFDLDEWSQERRSACSKSERNQFACSFLVLDRREKLP